MNGGKQMPLSNQTQYLLHSEVQVRGHLVDRGSRTPNCFARACAPQQRYSKETPQRLFFSVLLFLGRDAKNRMNAFTTLTYDPPLLTDVRT